uniref:K Homology domain-containing protein n=1 Tax=Rhizophagus irregularis (strain DAOM 181602 / DAOM 197198 / MUCL 43194) TaxID=747089 RepID=U9SYD9_RHIID
MEKQMQNSIRYSTVSTTMEIPKNVEIGKLIGRKGRNLKPIEEGTGTRIYINTEVNPRQIEIKINNDDKDRDENISPWDWINKAICQIDKLLEDIDIRSRRNDIEKEGKNSRISDNGNHQHATPRNHKDTDPKEKRKRFTTKTRQSLNKENIRRNVHIMHFF